MLLYYLGKLTNHLHRHMPGDIIDTAINQWRKCLQDVSVQMVNILNTVCEQVYANNCIFMCFGFKWHLPMVR